MAFFKGFTQRRIKTSGATINTMMAGSGEPVLLLHGYPQTNVMYHRLAPALGQLFTLVIPDLPGYGWSVGTSLIRLAIRAKRACDRVPSGSACAHGRSWA